MIQIKPWCRIEREVPVHRGVYEQVKKAVDSRLTSSICWRVIIFFFLFFFVMSVLKAACWLMYGPHEYRRWSQNSTAASTSSGLAWKKKRQQQQRNSVFPVISYGAFCIEESVVATVKTTPVKLFRRWELVCQHVFNRWEWRCEENESDIWSRWRELRNESWKKLGKDLIGNQCWSMDRADSLTSRSRVKTPAFGLMLIKKCLPRLRLAWNEL